MLPAGGDGNGAETLAAVEAQTRQPDRIVAVRHASGFQQAMWEGLDGDSEWFWLVDCSVVPEPDALERLLGALGRVEDLPEPESLSSKTVTADGSPDPLSLPVPHVFDPDLVVAAFDERLVPVRVPRRGSLLVCRRAFKEHGLPRLSSIFFGEDLVWAARLHKWEPGLLVPDSVVVCRPTAEPTEARRRREAVAEQLRLLVSDALNRGEKPWFAGRLAEQLAALGRGG